MKIYLHIILIIITINTCFAAPIIKRNAIHHPVIATNGMVASQEQHATEVGLNVLKNGGNAIDAAV
ncbi:MAG: gamma-glutamyltransferase, partial [Candidatus Margulisiibacteriota bacterium]|nr:gamma-glutamyltransferase [Candidatus Margulisiibacteriota bacterium]